MGNCGIELQPECSVRTSERTIQHDDPEDRDEDFFHRRICKCVVQHIRANDWFWPRAARYDRPLRTRSGPLCYDFNRQPAEDMLSIRLSLLGNLLISNEGFC